MNISLGQQGVVPGISGQRVRLVSDRSRIGTTTEAFKQNGPTTIVEVDWDNGERNLRRVSLLELMRRAGTRLDALVERRFALPNMLRRTLLIEKLRGDITDIFYSMGSTNTEFYPHQFKPVLAFVESTTGRLLIADEVGLGKTVEAMLIWKELRARVGARRLLIVCPAMLREKWRRDLQNLFNIDAQIAQPRDLKERMEAAVRDDLVTFHLIVGIEGLRSPKRTVDPDAPGTSTSIARLLEEHLESDEFGMFDLVVVDEAHYLRNPETANYALAVRLRDASRNFLLLTATPIQLHQDNLYRLLNLVDPDRFFSSEDFGWMIRENEPIIEALRRVWKGSDQQSALDALDRARTSRLFASDTLDSIRTMLQAPLDPDQRVRAARALESCSLTSSAMSRSRKREILPDRVVRNAKSLEVHFTVEERRVYDWVTARLRHKMRSMESVARLSLITRQRQMASCIPAAMRHFSNSEAIRELLFEDFGLDVEEDLFGDIGFSPEFEGLPIEIGRLEELDSKYRLLRNYLKSRDAREKILLFSYFRATISYLDRRLAEDGFRAVSIMGGDVNERTALIDSFREPDGPSLLLSTEVGAEGLDFQFCRTLVNYDLPWNPMRVEQRIGRLDRLGQNADRIQIANLWLADTIEEKILRRLYDRVDVFRRSIGDLEEILGTHVTLDGPIEQLLAELFRDDLTEQEREERANSSITAIANQREQMRALEEEAINLVGFTDYILDTIRAGKDAGRWIRPDDLKEFVLDFLQERYPGSRMERDPQDERCHLVALAPKAKNALQDFVENDRPATPTHLHSTRSSAVRVTFDPRWQGAAGRKPEILDVTHPFIMWIRKEISTSDVDLGAVPVIAVSASDCFRVAAGTYACAIDRWSFRGWRNRILLRFSAVRADDLRELDLEAAERLVDAAMQNGRALSPAAIMINGIEEALGRAEDRLFQGYIEEDTSFDTDNKNRCEQQKVTLERSAVRQISALQNRRTHILDNPNPTAARILPAIEGRIRHVEETRDRKLDVLERRRITDSSYAPVSAAIIVVTSV